MYPGSCWGLGESFRSTGLVYGVIDLEGKPRPNWGMSCSRIHSGKWQICMQGVAAPCWCSLKGKFGGVGGSAGEAGRGWLDQGLS